MEKTEIHVSEPEKRPARLTGRAMAIFGIAGVVLLSVIVVGIIASSGSDNARQAALEAKRAASARAFEKGDYNKALSELQGAPEQAGSKKEKADIYGEMAAAAASAGQVPQAIGYYNKKHEADPGSAKQDAYLLGALYERQGDKAKAIAQYTIAVNYMKTLPKTIGGSMDLQSLEGRLNELKAGQ